MSAVPSPREFTTSVIDALASVCGSGSSTSAGAGAGNPLQRVPAACRPLLTTLYALYPLTLLPALDLLDRRLATRVVVVGAGADADADAARPPCFYIVRSALPPSRRRPRHPPAAAGGPRYVVRPDAWNCTCAAFAFAAFPRRAPSPYVIEDPGLRMGCGAGVEPDEEEEREEEGTWQFGALSSDGRPGRGPRDAAVPCCKHLLACVLAERCGLGAPASGLVPERRVAPDEAAGWVADI
ncbi:hypothetical protein GGS23DRAFT_619860 [Durotheca rogersii]|uniref:uncharacterized protein n=1 Tax=Durotheca rogersii TaxID=419775 RepID=UPI002220A798|nr:uncharacterized protein GGS23DRAFT_619860 [Durotheca rogersii]KAI5864057.1 hypothetical protein GGS23DRAFT_619860 [Durotheca rogersii]